MRPWRLLIEVGQQETPAATVVNSSTTTSTFVDQGAAWETLKDARAKMLAAHARGDSDTVAQVNGWIGGGLALMADLTGENAATLLERLTAEVPSAATPVAVTQNTASPASNLVIETSTVTAPDSNAKFYHVERSRPEPPAGAPKPVDPADLTPKERAELGMFLPGEEPPSVPVKVTASDKKPAKKAPAKNKAAAKKAPAKKTVT